MAGMGDLNMQNPLWVTFLFYAAILALKTLAMAFLTARQRMGKLVFANPEDANLGASKGKVKFDDPDVERVRRAHQNDLENIVPFLLLCPLYISIGPSAFLATNLIRAFAGARILHSVVYLNQVRQPARAYCYWAGQAVNFFMSAAIILATL